MLSPAISWIRNRLSKKHKMRQRLSGVDIPEESEAGTLKSEVEPEPLTNPIRLPWGVVRERVCFPESVHISTSAKPGEFVLQTLFAEFAVLAEKKIEQVLEPPNKEKPLSKLLQRGEDPNFDQLLSALNSVSENCLPSLLRTLFDWYDRQNPMDEAGNCLYRRTNKNKGEKEFLCEKRDLAVDFIYCLVLIEILKQLPYHPGHDDLVTHIISLAFRHFKYREGGQSNPNSFNINIVADLYAEVIGVLAQSRFPAVKKRFMHELKELRNKEQTQHTTHCIISLLMGMKFFRVKMHPIEEFQACIQFLQECGSYFLELKEKDKEIKHALAGLFVEILLPVAAVAKNEVNVPILKSFVDLMYMPTLDLGVKRRHTLALFPMVTCLLCVSQKQFFLNNWPSFLTQCLLKLKDRDSTSARVALESLYRLLWVYMIRVKCESNTTTTSRLQSIVSSLFPKGTKVIVPKDAPLNIFVKIIQFIAQERLDFAMKEIIFDLLGVGKSGRPVYPERMCIGLRAFLVIADGRQQSEGEPPMPQTMGVLPSGSTLRFKKTFINKFLTDQTARNIGLSGYYAYVRKAFDSMLRTLDAQVGRPMLLIRTENLNRAADDIITGDRKPKIDLFRYCIAALPRLLPDGLSQQELIELLSRLTVHMDDELGKLAFQSLQNIPLDLPEWRNDVLNGFVHFILREVTDAFPQLLEQCNRRLIMLLTQWKTFTQANQAAKDKAEKDKREKNEANTELLTRGQQTHQRLMTPERDRNRSTLHLVESLALVMLCSCKPVIRKQAVIVLKEVRNIFSALTIPKQDGDLCVLDMMDRACPVIIEKVLPHLPGPEKVAALSASPVDFQWLTERTSIIWTSGNIFQMPSSMDTNENNNASTPAFDSASLSPFDSWIQSMTIFLHPDFVVGHCTTAVQFAWPFLFTRLQTLVPLVDPIVIMSERTSSLLRSKKVTSERDMHLSLWKNYVVMGCCIAPPSHPIEHHSASPDPTSASSPDTPDHFDLISRPVSPGMTARELFKSLTTYIKCEVTEMRETAVVGMGHINPPVFRYLLEELIPLIREAIDRKLDNRKKKRRDMIRLSLIHIFRLMAENAIFAQSSADVINPHTESLNSIFIEYIDGSRLFFELEADKEIPTLSLIRLHFSKFIHHLILNTPVSRRHKLLSQDLRAGLCMLFATWSGKFGQPFFSGDRSKYSKKSDYYSELEYSALQACAASLCCGTVYDPAGLNEDGYIYVWLNKLLATHDEKIRSRIYKLVQETIVLLLIFNHDAQTLLEWVIDRCYTGSHEIADGCFAALATVFNTREYPCDQVSILNLALLNTGSPRIGVQQMAVQLLRLLYKRFFMDDIVVTDHAMLTDREDDRDSVFLEEKRVLKEGLFAGASSCSQMRLSTILAALHPDQTMPIFSEIMHRLVTAQSSIRQNLLQYLVPWLHNMELVDHNIASTNPMDSLTSPKDTSQEPLKRPLKGRGWGSPEATNMILNNLFYVTLTLGDDHPREIENLWIQLVTFWPRNLLIIVRYVIITIGMYPQTLLPCAKKVIIYLAHAKPDRLVDEVINELRTAEPLPFNVERMETPPFYRVCKRQMTITSINDDEGDHRDSQHLDKGQIHTKRHSAEDPGKLVNMGTELVLGNSSASSSRLHMSSASMSTSKSIQEDTCMRQESSDGHCLHGPQPHPLPMPAYGGYYAPLSERLPGGSLPIPPYHRSNLAVMLLSDLVLDSQLHIDWTIHLPLMLHMLFLGLDNNRPLVHEHCKKLLLSLLLVFPIHNDHFCVAKMIIGNRSLNEESFLMLPRMVGSHDTDDLNDSSSYVRRLPVMDHVDNLTTDSMVCLLPVESFQTKEQVAKALIEFILTRKCRPLWAYEDITSKVHRIKSAENLEHLLSYVLRLFRDSLPSAHIEQRWAQESIHMALSCSSRHCAGRSFQIFRALHVPLNPSDLSDILSRLVETVAEQGEDMQGYVTEIMLTLEATVDNLDVDLRPLLKELCLSTPNLAKELTAETRKTAVIAPLRHLGPPFRSSSCNQSSIAARKAIVSSPPIMENKELTAHRHLSGDLEAKPMSNLSRSRSTQSLKHAQDPTGFDDRLTILAQMFWISVSMMESDFEYEFLLAIRLLDKVLKHLQPDRPECREKLDKILQLICWHDFPGVQALLLKGLTSPLTSDATWSLLSKLTSCISAPVVDQQSNEGFPKGLSIGFPMNVIALLPHLVEHYDDRSKMCIDAANNIADICTRQLPRLENLATVMMQYSQGTFTKDCFQWTKCVVKYLYDVYAFLSDSMIAFLVEILDKGPTCSQGAVLQILHCLVHYIDITQASTQAINADLLRVVARYVENPHHWKEALKIIKLCVTRSSTLAAAPPNLVRSSVLDISVLGLPPQFPQTEVKQALPGRTMDFKFDHSQIPIIGSKYWDIHTLHSGSVEQMDKGGAGGVTSSIGRHPLCADGTGSMSTGTSSTEGPVSSWKRPVSSQARTRERLVNLLNCYGPRVIPKSPSVVFDQQSPAGTLERASSITPGTSSDETSTIDGGITGEMQIEDNGSVERQIQSVFDFLEEPDTGCEYWGVNPRHSHSLDDEEEPGNQEEHKESSDDEMQSTSPVEELHPELSSGPNLPHRSHLPLDTTSTKNSICGSNQSIHSTCIDIDTMVVDISEYSPSAVSPCTFITAVPFLQEDIVQAWRTHVNHVIAEFNSTSSVNTFILFYRLFNETKSNLCSLALEIYSYLKVDSLKDLMLQLSLLETMMNDLECPLVFADSDAMVTCRLNERHRFLLLEINECYETYVMRQDQAIDSLDQLRSVNKLKSPGNSPNETSSIEQRLHLVASLYRLHFQLLQLFDSFSKLVNMFVQLAKASENVVDLTRELNVVRAELILVTSDEQESSEQFPYRHDSGLLSTAELELAVINCIAAHRFLKALMHAKQYSQLLHHELGVTQPFGDLETVLYLYSKHLTEAKNGYVAVCQQSTDLSQIYNHLMEIKVNVSVALESVRHRVRSPNDPTIAIKQSDSSTL